MPKTREEERPAGPEVVGEDGALSSVRSLDRPFQILEVLRERRTPMRLTEVAGAARLDLATTQRLLNLLVNYSYVARDGLDYRLGLTSLLNANVYLLTDQLLQIAEPFL